MKKCINFNTEKRKNAANSFEKDFFYHYQQRLWQSNGKPVKKNKCEISNQ